MRNLSQEFINKQKEGYGNYLKFADITLADGTELHLDNSNFWQNGFTFEDSVSGDSSFDIGAATVNKFSIVINNIYDEFTKYVFKDAKAVCYIGLEVSIGIEKIRICTGTIAEEPIQKSSIISLTFYDNMIRFDKDYSGVKTVFPATRNQIIKDICSYCDVTLQTQKFDRDDYIIQNRPTDDALTCRQMLSWVAQIGCQWAKCDEYGRLCIGWYKNIIPGILKKDESGTISAYEKDKIVHLTLDSNGLVMPETGYFDLRDGVMTFRSENDYENIISHTQNLSVNLDDVVITGVRVTEYIEESTEEKAKSYLYGEEGYVLNISENKLISIGLGETVAAMIGEKCVGMRFRPFSTSSITDIAIEAGDSVLITDRNGISYQSYITSVILNPGNFETLSCNAEPAQRNSAKRYTQLEQTKAEIDKNIQKEKNDREQAMEELADRISKSSGVFTTIETASGGGKIFYLHNKPNLSESDMVWKMTAEAWAVSTDGGKTWNGGMTVDGDTIVRILTATGVNASWINTGAITVKDSEQNIIFSVDMDTRKVIISGNSVQIGGKTISQAIKDSVQESKDYSDEKLSDYANTVSGDLENLQAQVDGQVEDWYFDYEPSMQNIPASQWTTTEERRKHIGDRFFWKSKGYAYRFMEDNGIWGWVLLKDTDITKAMQTAKDAKDTADGKRRTFVTTPNPPYDIGDLWTNGDDILTCTTSRAEGAIFAPSDWEKLNSYTDDTVANQALEEAKKARNLTMSLDNEYQGIPADHDGNIISPFPNVKTKVSVYYGNTDISENCFYSVQKSDSVTGNWVGSKREYVVTGLSGDTGWVDIIATYLTSLVVTKRFNISKTKGGKPGINGKNYLIDVSSTIVKIENGGLSPSEIILDGYEITGTGKEKYAGRFVIRECDINGVWSTVYTSEVDEYNVTYSLYDIFTIGNGDALVVGYQEESSKGKYGILTIPRTNIKELECTLYATGGTESILDIQRIPFLRDADSLTQEEIFNILTNDGEWRGIYKEGNMFFISFDYARGGALNLGGETYGNGEIRVYDENDIRVGKWSSDGFEAIKGKIGGWIIDDHRMYGGDSNTGVAAMQRPGPDNMWTFAAGGKSHEKYEDCPFRVSKYGKLYAENAEIKGKLEATSGTFKGELKGATGTFSGTVSAGKVTGSSISGGSLSIGGNFSVGGSGNLFARNPTFGQYVFMYGSSSSSTDMTVFEYDGSSLAIAESGMTIDMRGIYLYNMIKQNDFHGGLRVRGNLKVDGTKSRVVSTVNYGKVALNAVESPESYFVDYGNGIISEDGMISIFFDAVFEETIDTDCEYMVFTTRTSEKTIDYVEKHKDYFIVHGSPGATFDWSVVCKQKDYEAIRLQNIEDDNAYPVEFDESIFARDDVDTRILDEMREIYEREVDLL